LKTGEDGSVTDLGSVCFLHDRDFEPFAFVRGKRSTGLAVDIIRAALEGAGYRAFFWAAAMDTVPLLLKFGAADGMAVMGVTPQRRRHYDFSRPFLHTGGALFAPAGRTAGLTPETLTGHRVCTPGSGPLAPHLRRHYPGIRLLLVSDYQQALEAVVAGRATAAALNVHAGRHLVRRRFQGRLAPADGLFHTLSLAAAVTKGSTHGWMVTVNRSLERMQADGTCDRIVHKWL
jgi:two-component system, NarL family, sensor histidine kinase EvgS